MAEVKRKHQSGDRWGLVIVDLATGEERRVQIGGWESSTFPYEKQAREYAASMTNNADQYRKDFKGNKRYEHRYAGNWKQGIGPNWGWV